MEAPAVNHPPGTDHSRHRYVILDRGGFIVDSLDENDLCRVTFRESATEVAFVRLMDNRLAYVALPLGYTVVLRPGDPEDGPS